MSISPISTIALVTCDKNSKVNFAHVVGEMRRSLDKSTRSSYVLTWDHDDTVTFDFESTRIVLSLADPRLAPKGAVTDQLFISVGSPSLDLRRRDPAIAHEQLCSTIVERVCDYYETKSVYWQQVDECVTSETVDRIFDHLVSANPASETIEVSSIASTVPLNLPQENLHQSATPSEQAPSNVVQMAPSQKTPTYEAATLAEKANVLNPANDLFQDFLYDLDRLDSVRSALYESKRPSVEPQKEMASPIIRVTATALDATMVLVCLPLGAAMLTYHVFRGGELRRSSQMITLTGLFMASSKAVAAMQIIPLS